MLHLFCTAIENDSNSYIQHTLNTTNTVLQRFTIIVNKDKFDFGFSPQSSQCSVIH